MTDVGKKPRFPDFAKCVTLMRKRDPQAREDGFHWLLPHAAELRLIDTSESRRVLFEAGIK